MIALRHLSLVLCLFILGAGIGVPAARAGQRRAPGSGIPLPTVESAQEGRIVRLERWLVAAARHTPGEDDDALEKIASWPNRDLEDLWVDANVLVQVMRGSKADRFSIRTGKQQTSTQILYSKTQLGQLRALACAAGGVLMEAGCMLAKAGEGLDSDLRQLAVLARSAKVRGDDNYILRRGALLHGDVAVLAPRAMIVPTEARSTARPQRFRMEISDGREVGMNQSAVHWEIARMLLDFVKPRGSDRADPGRDEMVRQWYRATAAWMQRHEDHDRAHLGRARELFPSDPDILFLSACQSETYAGVQIQAAVQSAVLATGVTLEVGSERTELRDAERLFRRTLEIRPEHAEARMRLGRVLALLGRHADAAAELRRASEALTETQLRYYVSLFLGAEEEALGNREAARTAYEQANTLAPVAQSPLLALSQLARRSGDRAAALRAMDRMFALEIDDPHDDPWWWYYVDQGRDADDLLDSMRRPFLAERLQ